MKGKRYISRTRVGVKACYSEELVKTMVSSTNVCVYLVFFIGLSAISHGSLVIYDPFDDFV